MEAVGIVIGCNACICEEAIRLAEVSVSFDGTEPPTQLSLSARSLVSVTSKETTVPSDHGPGSTESLEADESSGIRSHKKARTRRSNYGEGVAVSNVSDSDSSD